jgi:hypothetical protein
MAPGKADQAMFFGSGGRGLTPFGVSIAVLAATVSACNGETPSSTSSGSATTQSAPTFFLGDQFTATQSATQAVVDAGVIWLLDANGDFVFGTDPAANWNARSGLSLTWRQVPGATKYRVLGRNTYTMPVAWKELSMVPAPDPALNPTVVATGVNPWTAGLGTGGNPWSFTNHVEFAISAEDENGVLATNGISTSLDTADVYPGHVTGIEIDRAGLPVPFDAQVERGDTFQKTIRITFSEPMRTDAAPTLSPRSANVTLRRVVASAWGSDPAIPASSPPSAAANAFLKVELTVKGPCTELLVDRAAGDVILVLRDATMVTTGTATHLLFLDGATGDFLAEAADVVVSDPVTGQVAVGEPLTANAPAGALACAAAGGSFAVPGLVSGSGARVVVTDATPFFVGERVAIHHPSAGSTAAVHDVRTVSGVDTVANVLVLSDPLSAGNGTGSAVIPLSGLGGEVALRPSVSMVLQRDAAGGTGRELLVAAPSSVMVGDTIIVDADGKLGSTADQAQAVVKQVKFAPTSGTTFSIVADLPPTLLLLHGRAVVIGAGDSFAVGGSRDTTAAATTPLNEHGDQFGPDGLRY